MTLTLIELVQTGAATWDVHLGEGDHRLDISNIVEYLHLELDARTRVPKVLLNLTAEAKFHLQADVVIDNETNECLRALGWTPPRKAGDPLAIDADKASDALRDWREELITKYGDKPLRDVFNSVFVMADINLKLAQAAMPDTKEN